MATDTSVNSQANLRWWTRKRGEVGSLASDIFSVVKYIDRNQSYRQNDNYKYFRMYGNTENQGFGPYSTNNSPIWADQRVTYNVVQSVCDTITAKIAKNKPRVTFLTSGGDYGQKRKAKLLEKFTDGIFYLTNFYRVRQENFLNACIFGTGMIKIFRHNDKIMCEKVYPGEIYVEDVDGRYATPRCMYQLKYVPREVLLEVFPEKKSIIMRANNANAQIENYSYAQMSFADYVLVIEAWHLPSGPDADDGRHAIVIENDELCDDPWTKDYFPFVVQRYNKRPLGFYGQGAAEMVTGIQVEINKILMKIQKAFNLLAVPQVWISNTSKINKASYSNEIAAIGTYSGTPPVVTAFQLFSPEVYQQLENLYRKAFELVGVSQLSAQSKKPSGLDAAVAMREYQDIETERFSVVAQTDEELCMEAAKQFIDLAKEIADEYGEFEIVHHDGKSMSKIKWSDIDLDKEAYVMAMFPTSFLPRTPAGKLATVQELIQAGFISKESGLRLLDYPDLEAEINLMVSSTEDIDRAIEMIVDEGKYMGPEPVQDLVTGIKRFQSSYLKYRADGLEQERLDLLLQWMSDANSLLQMANPPPAALPPPEPPMGAPQAVPSAPPVSDLLPNAPVQ